MISLISIKSALTEKNIQKYFNRVFCIILLLELYLGGSGRLLEITPTLTLRMVLFSIALFIAMLNLVICKKINRNTAYATGALTVTLTISTIIGLVNGASFNNVWGDIKPLLSFFTIIYLSISIRTINDTKIVEKIIMASCCILAAFHIIIFTMLQIYIYDLNEIYTYIAVAGSLANDGEELSGVSEFFLKGSYGLINYKGDMYMCIGFIFIQKSHYRNQLRKLFILLLIGFSIILTGTRGFIVMLAAIYLIEWAANKPSLRSVLIIILLSVPSLIGYFWFKSFTGDKDESDEIRYQQIEQVVERINPVSLFIGHGLGIGIPVRPEHMEISYLEIFHKQGLPGLFFWVYILWLVYWMANKTGKNGQPFLLSTAFVALLSLTNPYINHPLGITVIITSISCLSILVRVQLTQQSLNHCKIASVVD